MPAVASQLSVVAAFASHGGGRWVVASLLVALLVLLVLVALLARRPLRAAMLRRLARREEREGWALLEVAREIDAHAAHLEGQGVAAPDHRSWARRCRAAAGASLGRINALILEDLRLSDRHRPGSTRHWPP